MKIITLLLLLFITSGVIAKKTPKQVQSALQKYAANPKLILISIDLKDCKSCTVEYYKTVQNLYKEYNNATYFCVPDQKDYYELEYLLKTQDVNVRKEHFIIDNTLSAYFVKNAKNNTFAALINGNNFSFLNMDDQYKYAKQLAFINNDYIYVLQDSAEYDVSIMPTINNTKVNFKDNGLTIINHTDGNFYTINYATKQFSGYAFENKMNKDTLLKNLHLVSEDLELTKKNNLKSKIEGEKFLTIETVEEYNGNYHVAFNLAYTHLYRKSELDSALVNAPKAIAKVVRTEKSPQVTRTNSNYYIAIFNSNYDFISIKYLKDDNVEQSFYLNSFIYDSLLNNYTLSVANYTPNVSDEEFNNQNFLTASYTNNPTTINFEKYLTLKKPIWFGNKKLRNNFNSAHIKMIAAQKMAYMISYPIFYNLTNNITYELPNEVMDEILKNEKSNFLKKEVPAFFCLGILKYSNEYVLACYNRKSKNLYFMFYKANGTFTKYIVSNNYLNTYYFATKDNLVYSSKYKLVNDKKILCVYRHKLFNNIN